MRQLLSHRTRALDTKLFRSKRTATGGELIVRQLAYTETGPGCATQDSELISGETDSWSHSGNGTNVSERTVIRAASIASEFSNALRSARYGRTNKELPVTLHPLALAVFSGLTLQMTWKDATFTRFGTDDLKPFRLSELSELKEKTTHPACCEMRLIIWTRDSKQSLLQTAEYGNWNLGLDEDHNELVVVKVKNDDRQPVTLGQVFEATCESFTLVRKHLIGREIGRDEVVEIFRDWHFGAWRHRFVDSTGCFCLSHPMWENRPGGRR